MIALSILRSYHCTWYNKGGIRVLVKYLNVDIDTIFMGLSSVWDAGNLIFGKE